MKIIKGYFDFIDFVNDIDKKIMKLKPMVIYLIESVLPIFNKMDISQKKY